MRHTRSAGRLHAGKEPGEIVLQGGFSWAQDDDAELEAARVWKVRELEGLGATIVCLQNGSGADPIGAIHTYGERVLPALKGARV